ncbi:ssDNA endodeoxyribonuclease RAD1 [Rhodotorula paludigena]|uniref:ssDNA endodeoxyribonuclease RAD1 n=1 Tax=Rhodotorula paludigena TaxID=86838 RepID=UPI0031783E38
MPPSRTPSDPGRGKGKSKAADSQQDKPTKVKPVNATKGAVDSTLLLPFQASVLQQLVPPENAAPSTGDALLIMARGLGLRTVVTTFLKIYDLPEKLVLVVNATPEEERSFSEEVGMRLKVVGFELNDTQRERMYKDGGIFSVTSRILIVDMLKGRIPVELITGLVVLHAEEVKPTSQEAFVVRIYREKNKIGFLKAFSDRPESFTFGLSPLETTLKQLKLREVMILPRFHDEVDADLQKRRADVVEIYQPLTHNMADVQTAILECMEMTLAEIKRSNSYLEVEDLTVENALFKSFDRLVRIQLDPVWHKVGPKTRGLVNDLTTLRKLQEFLLSFDCVRFNQYLETLLSSYTPSVGGLDRRDRPAWLGTPAADTIFTVSRNRVYLQKAVAPPAAPDKGKERQREMTVDGIEIPDDLADEDWMLAGAADADAGPTEEEEAMLREIEEAAMRERDHAASPAAASSDAGAASGANPDRQAMPPPQLPGNRAAASAAATPAPAHPPKKRPRIGWMPPGVEPVLEEQPKWAVLAEVLDEIEQQMIRADHFPYGSNDTILVMCNSTSTCLTLGNYLSAQDPDNSESHNMLESKLSSYFYWKAHMGKLQRTLKRTPGFNKGERRSSSASSLAGSSTSTSANGGPTNGYGASKSGTQNGGGGGAYGPGKKDDYELSAALRSKDLRRGSAPPTKRRRVRGGGAAGSSTGATRSTSGAGGATGPMFAAATGANPEAFEEDVSKIADMVNSTGAPTTVEADELDEDEAFNELDFNAYFGLISNEDLVIIRPYLDDEDDRVLDELRPKYVVMYDPTPAFVRRIETYRAAHPGLAIRVYFLVYKDSVEEQKYLSEIRREKDAFVRLIQEKGSMAIPHEAEYRPHEDEGELLRTVPSRIGGGKHATQEIPKVIVDMREFRSSLPSLLHAAHIEVIPVTLGIGDYIITPEMAVERKSIADLISSFNSGRLFQQCELLTAHYKEPILLIEFDEKKSFNLETYVETRTRLENASEVDLRSKLVLLTISFPKLRLIWSSSPYQTVEIFRDLKENRDEPDPAKAVLVGVETDEGGVAAEGTLSAEAGFNIAPQEMLRALPGVSSKNYRYLSSQVENMEKLVQLELNEVQALIGNEPGKQLHGFIHTDVHY